MAYDRERGRFHVFKAKAVVFATGGVGRAFKITSNSWEGTGDGHALAYRAGAELIDMEFIQFHPTGMVWPPSVKGILVTEGVRGEGGVLRNSEGRRFMFDDIPDNYKPQTASDPEEGWRYVTGRQERPSSAGTADPRPRGALHQPRGQGRPWISAWRRVPRHRVDQGKDQATRKTTSSESFRACITSSRNWPTSTSRKSRWKSGPPRTTSWAASAWTATRRSRAIPGLFAAGECAAGINGANRLGGNSLSDLIVFGKRAGEYAAQYARQRQAPHVNEAAIQKAHRRCPGPVRTG